MRDKASGMAIALSCVIIAGVCAFTVGSPASGRNGSPDASALEIQVGEGSATLNDVFGTTKGDSAQVFSERRVVPPGRARAAARTALASSPLLAGKRVKGRMPAEPYIPQQGCYPFGLPGVVAFRDMLLQTYPRSAESLSVYNIGRGCNVPGVSEHEEGRALDFQADIRNPQQHAQALRVLQWLTRNHGREAKRWGILYIIYDQSIWGQYNPRWRAMSNRGGWTDNHKDHIHFTFTWNGALEKSVYFTGKVAPTNFGPCAKYSGSYAPMVLGSLEKRAHTRPCRSPKRLGRHWHYGASIMYWQNDSRVLWLQEFLREEGIYSGTVDGEFGGVTYQAIQAWQKTHHVPRTGVWDAPTQNASHRVVGKRARTVLTGWDPAAVNGTPGQLVPFSVTSTDPRFAERTVRLQRRSTEPGATWETLVIQTVGDGKTFSGNIPVADGAYRYRVLVDETSWASRATTPLKAVSVTIATPVESTPAN